MSYQPTTDALSQWLALLSPAFKAKSVAEGCQSLLPGLLRLAGATGGLIVASDPRLLTEHVETLDLTRKSAEAVSAACWTWFDALSESDVSELAATEEPSLRLYAVRSDERLLGMIGIEGVEKEMDDEQWSRVISSIGQLVDCLAEKASLQRRLLRFRTFQDVSSLLARPLGLSESLDLALFSSMKAVSAEAASVLLLDVTEDEFRFFHVEGSAKPKLGERRFSAQDGIAGRVLRTQEAEVVNEVASDSQFYGRIDSETGFQTRNLIAVPLIAGNEPVGVLEVLNRSENTAFTAEDRLLLTSVADQIAYAIRKASIFDRVVSAYCRRHAGEASCDGCPQPLEGWGPCAEYRSRDN